MASVRALLRRALGVAALVAGVSALAAAQIPHGPAWKADSIALAGDTAAALALLDSVVRADRRDAEAWYRRGMIRWANARSKRSGGFIREKRVIDWLRDADSSLRIAHAIAPDTARYAVALGRFFLNSGVSTVRFAAKGIFEDGLEAAAKVDNPYMLAEAADELGMTYWRRYQPLARRALGGPGVSGAQLDSMGSLDRRQLADFNATQYNQVEGDNFTGRQDYERALGHFKQAVAAMPDHPRAARHLYMVLADREEWDELASVTSARAATAPWDANAHLARGLALHRLARGGEAQAAFDTALALLPEDERARLTALERILRTAPRRKGEPSDSAVHAARGRDVRAYFDSTYWQLSDPLSLTPENEYRNEYLARVVYAELAWTSDDLDRRGADSDRGEAWIRWGPPMRRWTTPAKDFSTVSETWLYDDGLAITFQTPPAFGTARYADQSYARAQEVKATRPASWANVPINRRIDSIHVQLARFRGAGDSTDLVMVAELPTDSLFRGLDLASAALDVGAGVWTGPSVVLLRDSSRLVVDLRDSVNLPRLRTWRERLPVGDHVYRIEALQPDGMRGARALGAIALTNGSGFGTSDLLVATEVGTRSGAAPQRWRDLIVAPNAGTFARGRPIGLVWETYGLAAAPDGGTKYRVSITLERRFESKGSAFVASVVSGVSGAAGLSAQEKGGKAALRFERSGPAGAVALDWLTLDVGTAPRGTYRVVVEVTDLVTRQVVRTTREVRII